MKISLSGSLLFTLSMLFDSCCGSLASGVRCVNEDQFSFRILSVNEENLFLPPSPYKIEDLKLHALDKNNNRIDTSWAWDDGSGNLSTSLDYKFSTTIIEIQGNNRDTIYFDFSVSDDRCCGKESRIKTVTIKGKEITYNHFDAIDIIID